MVAQGEVRAADAALGTDEIIPLFRHSPPQKANDEKGFAFDRRREMNNSEDFYKPILILRYGLGVPNILEISVNINAPALEAIRVELAPEGIQGENRTGTTIGKETTMTLKWIAERLHMGTGRTSSKAFFLVSETYGPRQSYL